MSEPLSWQALQSIGAELAVIRIANGYHTDLGAAVEFEPRQAVVGDPDRLVLAVPGQIETQDYGSSIRVWRFTAVVEAELMAVQINGQLRAHRAVADVLRVFPSPRDVLLPGGVCAQVRVAHAEVLGRVEGLSAMVAQVRLAVEVREVLS